MPEMQEPTQTQAQQPAEPEDQAGGGFKPITSQEELDHFLGYRLGKERDNTKKEAARADKAEESVAKLQQQIDAMNESLSEYKQKDQVRTWVEQVSAETGIPQAALRGNTLEEIKSHANILKEYIKQPASAPVVPSEGAKQLPKAPEQGADPLRALLMARQ